MTWSLLLGAAVAVLVCAAASAPGLSQARFQGGVSVSVGGIDNAAPGRKRAKRKGTP
jgi:hypothetical protein